MAGLDDPRYGMAEALMLRRSQRPGGYAGFDDDREARHTDRVWPIVLGLMLGLAGVLLLVRDSGAVQ